MNEPTSSRHRVATVVALLFAGAFSGCTCGAPRADEPPSASSSATLTSSATVEAPVHAKNSDVIKPIYPKDDGAPPDPVVVKYCDSVIGGPESRRTACCPDAATFSRVEECKRTLGFAVRTGAVKIDAAALDACARDVATSSEGCDWVGFAPLELPASCDAVLRGAIQEGKECRSSLECAGDLRCQGVSAVELGKCGPPRAARYPCGTGIDVLAAGTGQVRFDRAHRECEGYCKARMCVDATPVGQACSSEFECGKGSCIDGKCSDLPLPGAGQACAAGACGVGLKCHDGKCAAPKKEGEACSADDECRSVCARDDGGSEGKCSKLCPRFVVPKMPMTKPTGTVAPGGRPPPRR